MKAAYSGVFLLQILFRSGSDDAPIKCGGLSQHGPVKIRQHGRSPGLRSLLPALQIVWFKRDLRMHDHRPLQQAAERGPVLPLYVVEPELWRQPDGSERQWLFCRESLLDLRQALAGLGQPLVVRSGDVVEVFERARSKY